MKKLLILSLLFLCSFCSKDYSTPYYATTWAGTASNQAVTFYAAANAIATDIFPAGGTAITGSNKLMTKAEAATYLNINTSYSPYAAKSSGQLVVKSDLQPSASSIGICISGYWIGGSTSVEFCANSTVSVNTNVTVYFSYRRRSESNFTSSSVVINSGNTEGCVTISIDGSVQGAMEIVIYDISPNSNSGQYFVNAGVCITPL